MHKIALRLGGSASTIVLLLAASGMFASPAAACNPGWTRSPNDSQHYFAAAQEPATGPHLFNGFNSLIYITNPSVPHGDSWTWIGMLPEGISHIDHNHEPLVQEGYQKGSDQSHTSFFLIINGDTGQAVYQHSHGNLNVGSQVNFDLYYDSGTIFLEQAGVVDQLPANLYISGLSNSTRWWGWAANENTTYADQMPGTLSNYSSITNLWSRYGTGSNATWDKSSDQGWSTTNGGTWWNGYPGRYPAHWLPGGVGQNAMDGSFQNWYDEPSLTTFTYDTCSSS
jgi:hypothetical protein